MLFWIIAALLTFGASFAILLPLARKAETETGSHDMEVYRDQLAEVDRDVARKLIAREEAEQARAEIGRRIIRIDAEHRKAASAPVSKPARWLGALAVLAVPLISWGVYGSIGSPSVPSQPLAARLAEEPRDNSVEELVGRAEAHLASNPDDARGWEVLAPIYMRIGRFGDAVTAYRNTIRLAGATAAREAGLGEAIVNEGGGLVSADAQAAFERALLIEKDFPKARYYLAMALAQEGKHAEAVEAWQQMRQIVPADSPWQAAAQEAIAATQQRSASAPQNAAPGPSNDDIEAAENLSGADRTAMIEQMVASLDQKLRRDAADPDGWMRLIRSYMVLGKPDEARDALKRSLAALGADSEGGRKVAAFASTLNLVATE